ncbi:MAG: hypothetical protein LBF12_06795 [Christensenellaceae bacterium]|jgi:hypothetical protein|nr:hypothetical protein [Christensenellaceae bacterium]
MTKKNLPIKVIIKQERDIKPNQGGSKRKFFRDITTEFIEEISSKFSNIARYYNNVFSENEHLPAVGKLVLIEDAIAKSYRPNDLCQDLEIIGAGDLQELYVKVTKEGLNKTITRINHPHRTQSLEANLTTVKDIVPILPAEKLSVNLIPLINQENTSIIKKLKIKCFSFGNTDDDTLIREYVKNKIVALSYEVPNLRLFRHYEF